MVAPSAEVAGQRRIPASAQATASCSGDRSDLAELAAAYLVSEDASFETGTELVVDGGFRAR
ncbi:hypothetical protein EEB14_45435 [Rhodococcus sp. WS4]|nr:hypothetical protein EEB14_45435 [Rhodococcus sp. WS4]